jgi:putative thioredoxin
MATATAVTTADFETEVIAASMQVPVLVDFWAPWCAPCRTLGPILDTLAADLAGQLKVVKVNADEEQQLAGIFGIRSLPTVMLIKGGQPVDGFMGAQPESTIRQWLAPHLGPAPEIEPELAPEPAPAPAMTPEQALAQARRNLAAEPDQPGHAFDLIDALIGVGELDEARARLDELPAAQSQDDRARRAGAALELHYLVARAPTIAELDARLQRDPDDHEARHLLGLVLLLDGDHATGLDTLLELMRRSRAWGEDRARKSLVQAFALVTDPDLVGQARRRMSSLLF